MPNNPFIDQEMDCEMTNKNDETSETSKGDTDKENFQKVSICQSSACLKCVQH